MKFYSGRGDDGTSTFFGSSERFSKNSPLFEALGALDELNSYLGICRSYIHERASLEDSGAGRSLLDDPESSSVLKSVQENLFILQAILASPQNKVISPVGDEKLRALEAVIDRFGDEVGEIRKFVIPGASPLSAHLDYARALARSVERKLTPFKDDLGDAGFAYVNRLSSLLFILARLVNKRSGLGEDSPSYI